MVHYDTSVKHTIFFTYTHGPPNDVISDLFFHSLQIDIISQERIPLLLSVSELMPALLCVEHGFIHAWELNGSTCRIYIYERGKSV